MVKETLNKLTENQSLTFDEASSFLDAVANGSASQPQIAAFLTGLRVKGETVSEIAGCAASLKRHSLAVPHHREIVVDCCGTGGDGSHSFNISTAASLIVAACGVAVAKHGNRAVSSSCGSADILEAAGAKLELTPSQAAMLLDELGYCFLFAPMFHPAMKFVAPVRKELCFRTVFNLLGPLLNPAGATHQLIGTATSRVAEMLASVTQYMPETRIVTVHNSLGYDEILSFGNNHRFEWLESNLFTDTIAIPQNLQNGYQPANLTGGDAATNVRILMRVLAGEASAYRDTAILNAGFTLIVANQAESLEQGAEMALEAVMNGKATKLLADYVNATREITLDA